MGNGPRRGEWRRVVVVGGGFGGLETARQLCKACVQVTLVDRHNYHLFQPLLYQVATGGLSPANITTPLRYIFRRQANCEVLLAEVTDVDIARQQLILADGRLAFDDLVVAAGSTYSYFGHDSWSTYAPGLKSIEDATSIRRRIFLAFEAAERETRAETRDALMTFVVVGGGPTGVELAGALAEIARHTLKHDFRRINPVNARILLVEAGDHVLSNYAEDLRECAAKKICELGIELHTQTRMTKVAIDHLVLKKNDQQLTIATRTVLWAAGVKANPLALAVAQACGVETDRGGRVPVTRRLHVPGHENIFAIGDMAACLDEEGNTLPGLAPVAIQQGKYVARVIADRIEGRPPAKPFQYVDRGAMATIGRAAAVAQIGKRKLCGLFAWLLWLAVHLMLIVQFQNRVLVFFQWAWNYVTFSRRSRIITGDLHVVVVENFGSELQDGEAEPAPPPYRQ